MRETPPPAYVLITPCRDEVEFAVRTLESVLAQTVRPAAWVIVDDGSTDGTLEILQEFEAKHSLIRVIQRENRGVRKVGAGVIETFNVGLDSLDLDDYEFLCKLDLDIELPETYFEVLLDRMQADERLGTCSGKAYYHASEGNLIREAIGDEVSLGMTKFYRTTCFEQISGFVSEVMWDGIDCHQCRRKGWKACSWDDEAIRFLHLRPMGSSHNNILTGRARHGRGQYFMGTGISFILASAVFRLFKTPAVSGSMAMLGGYLSAALKREERYDDPGFRRFLRSYQWSCLLRGKRRTIARLDDHGEALWRNRDDPLPTKE